MRGRVLGLVLVAGTAACLLNPHHYHAFALPAVLPPTPFANVLEREDLFRQLFYGLFQDDYWQSRATWTPASLALWPLLVLGLVSFACTLFTGWRWWRLTVWLAFLLLGVYHVLRNSVLCRGGRSDHGAQLARRPRRLVRYRATT